MEETGTSPGRMLGWISAVGFALAVVLLGRLTLDLGKLHVALALSVGLFYLGFLAVVGANVADLVRARPVGPALGGARRWALALAVPAGLLASMLDCMGLEFSGCTSACEFMMHVIGPAVAVLALAHAATGAGVFLLGSITLGLALVYPNCICRNPVNAGWIDLLGRSPACYAVSFAVLLIAGTALATQRRVGLALVLSWGVVAAALAFWVGHHYFHVPW